METGDWTQSGMWRGRSHRRVAMFVSGVALLFLGLLALVTVTPSQSASLDPKVPREMFHKLYTQLVTTRSHSKPGYNSTRSQLRRLQSIEEEAPTTDHHIRHAKHKKMLEEQHQNRSRAHATHSGSNWTGGIQKKPLDPHNNCYTTNEVLEIIAITCLVNFVFWFLIISCVNFYTRTHNICKSSSCESLESLASSSEYQVLNDKARKNDAAERSEYSDVLKGYRDVHAYIAGLPTGQEDSPMISLQDLPCRGAETPEKKGKNTTNFPNQLISVDNLKPLFDKNPLSREKHKKLQVVNSFSMEDLIF